MYKREGRLAMKHMWIVVLVSNCSLIPLNMLIKDVCEQIFAVVQVIVSIAVAVANSNATDGGYKSASFAAIWSMFLVIIFTAVGGNVVLGGRSSELLVGFLIGVAAMLTELFFVLMVTFFVLGQDATVNNFSKNIHALFPCLSCYLCLFISYGTIRSSVCCVLIVKYDHLLRLGDNLDCSS